MNTKKYQWLLIGLWMMSSVTFAQIPAKPQEESILYLGATAHLGNGDVIENSAIGFSKGKIILVGNATQRNIIKSDYQKVIDVSGKHIYPAFIDPNITIGLMEIEAVRATVDFSEAGNYNPNARTLVAYNTDSKIIPTIRTNGVLLAQSAPRGGVISGTSSVFALDGWNWEDAVYKKDDGVHLNWPKFYNFNFSEDGNSGYEKNKNYENSVAELVKFFKEAKSYCLANPIPETNLRFEAMRNVFNGTANLYINAASVKEISEAVMFTQQMAISKPVLVGAEESFLCTGLIKQYSIPVILGRTFNLPYKNDDDVDLPYKLPAILQKAGILFCISTEGDMEIMHGRNLPFMAGQTVSYGLNKEQALMAITLNAAKILGIDKTTGTLEVGKDANLFISDGDALDMRTNKVTLAYIKGMQIDLDNLQLQLYNKYKAKYGLN